MIEKIDFEHIEKSNIYGYAKELEFFKANKSIEFKPGLNIIFAPNGTGKSTLLEIMAKFTASEQGGVSTITNSWFYDMISHGKNKMEGIEVSHDGQPTLYNNPRKAVGLIGGMAGFDDDFFDQGIMETQLRQSTGYTTMARLNKVLAVLAGKAPMPTDFHYKTKMDEKYDQFLKAKIEKGQQTMLLDEPESGLAIHVQANIFRMIQKKAMQDNLQIIVATHSPFALTLNANFIELQPDYINVAKREIELVAEIFKLQEQLKEVSQNKTNKEAQENAAPANVETTQQAKKETAVKKAKKKPQ